MADTKIFDFSALGAAPATGDVLPMVDVSDNTQSAEGSTKKMTVANLFTSPSIANPTITGHPTVEGVTATGATGTGKFVFDGTPTLVTPVLGVATATSVNKVALTAPATGSTLTIADGKTLTASNTLTLAGTDATVMTFPTTSATIARTDAANTFTGNQTAAALFTTNLDAGASGTAGTVDIFPTTAAKGKIALTAADNAGNTTTTIVNAEQAGARTYTIPDAGASASFVMTAGNQTIGGDKTLSGTLTVDVIASSAGTAEAISATAAAQAADTVAGSAVTITASNAVAGDTNAGAEAGGSVTITAGDADRLTSGDANGGSITLVPGAGIGTGVAGSVVVSGGLDVGASGTAGTVDVFPSTAASGKLSISVTDQAADTTVGLVIGAMAAARTITLPDPLAASNVMVGTQSSTARTATADGTGTGTIADAGYWQFVTVTCDDAAKIIVLPTPTPGKVVVLANGATGYELRSSSPATVAINGGAEADAESAIAADSMVFAICTSATTWQALSLTGETLAAVEAAAAA